MSYTYLQEQGEVSSVGCFADIPQYVLSRLNLIAEKSYSKDSETESCQSSQSGMMCEPLTENHGEGKLTSCAGDSLVKTSVALGKERELKDQEVVCGNTWRESSVKFDLDTLSWKTHQCLWEEDLEPSSLTLPKWGMMRNGVLWERITSPLLTEETESGSLLPTPTCADATMGAILNDNTKLITLKSGKLRKISNQGVSGSIGLARTVAMWPTPQARDYKGSSGRSLKGLELDLPTKVKMWPTPTCHNAKECDAPAEAIRNTPTLCHVARGGDKTQPKHLNPTWVEWLMGWPLGWTDLKPLAMGKFQQWRHSHGVS
jgi:hypothetical protein